MSDGERQAVRVHCSLPAALAVFCILGIAASGRCQTTGTFIDRLGPTDLRLMDYNVEFDSAFPDTNAQQAAKFGRLIAAIPPDIVTLQEVYSHTASQTVSLLNSLLPLGGSATWYAYKGGDSVIASRYPLSLTRSNTSPTGPSGVAIALVDLPDNLYATDFYFMVNHYKCCGDPGGPEDALRQQQSDALVNWMRDARTAGGSVTLANNVPMAVVGDLNIVGSLDPLNNLIDGNIVNQATYGSSSPPDWIGTSLGDAHPLHNASGPADYTWRNDQGIYAPGRLDYVLYTDSVARIAHKFVLNTVDMSASELAATGLQTYDVTDNTQGNYDHLPQVEDFRFVADATPGDYNLDRVVNASDYQL
jgi:endonuclease/exonuclease/phosphatase family metal-dependent hydrolase